MRIHTGHMGAGLKFPLIPAYRQTATPVSFNMDIIFIPISYSCSLFSSVTSTGKLHQSCGMFSQNIISPRIKSARIGSKNKKPLFPYRFGTPWRSKWIGTLSGRLLQTACRYMTYAKIIRKQITLVMVLSFFADIRHTPFIAG